jgi:hypothetical protein
MRVKTVWVRPVGAATADVEIVPKIKASEVLVVGGDDWAVSGVSDELAAKGRRAHRCHDSAESPFPCNAMIPGRGCPLDQNDVDVVVIVHSRPQENPTLSDMGAVCGLRDGIPVVLAGMSAGSPFATWAVKVPPDGDVVATCDRTVWERHQL